MNIIGWIDLKPSSRPQVVTFLEIPDFSWSATIRKHQTSYWRNGWRGVLEDYISHESLWVLLPAPSHPRVSRNEHHSFTLILLPVRLLGRWNHLSPFTPFQSFHFMSLFKQWLWNQTWLLVWEFGNSWTCKELISQVRSGQLKNLISDVKQILIGSLWS